MILSHKHKFIFLKTNKTAGTSIEFTLSQFCGPADILTDIPGAHKETHIALKYPGAQNHYAPLSDYSLNDYRRLLYGKRKTRYYNHMSAAEVRGFVGEDIWNSYYKFCVERNPWDRLLSFYYWQSKADPTIDLDRFLASGKAKKLKRRGIQLYTIDGQIAVDKICLYENLASDLEDVRRQLNMPEPLALPKTKSGTRKDKRHYRDILSPEQQAKIAELFADEIDLFAYKF